MLVHITVCMTRFGGLGIMLLLLHTHASGPSQNGRSRLLQKGLRQASFLSHPAHPGPLCGILTGRLGFSRRSVGSVGRAPVPGHRSLSDAAAMGSLKADTNALP